MELVLLIWQWENEAEQASSGSSPSQMVNIWLHGWKQKNVLPVMNAQSSIPKYLPTTMTRKHISKNPDGGPYQDLVKAAEKCTARVIHPGLPADRSGKGY